MRTGFKSWDNCEVLRRLSHVISAIVIQPGALNRFPHYLYTGWNRKNPSYFFVPSLPSHARNLFDQQCAFHANVETMCLIPLNVWFINDDETWKGKLKLSIYVLTVIDIFSSFYKVAPYFFNILAILL